MQSHELAYLDIGYWVNCKEQGYLLIGPLVSCCCKLLPLMLMVTKWQATGKRGKLQLATRNSQQTPNIRPQTSDLKHQTSNLTVETSTLLAQTRNVKCQPHMTVSPFACVSIVLQMSIDPNHSNYINDQGYPGVRLIRAAQGHKWILCFCCAALELLSVSNAHDSTQLVISCWLGHPLGTGFASLSTFLLSAFRPCLSEHMDLWQ